jgi:hypothetical protein
MDDRELQRKRRELAEKVRSGTVHTSHPAQKKERQAWYLSFWFWLKAIFLTGCGSLSGMMVVSLLMMILLLCSGCIILAVSGGLGVYLLDLLYQIGVIPLQ